MKYLRATLARIAGFFRGHRGDGDLKAELREHLEMETAENIRRGMDPDEARRQALLASGGITQAAEAVHDQRGLPWIESAAADLRYAVRALRRTPGFAMVVILTLGLGIGANTAIFTVVRAVLLKPLPYREGDRLMFLRQSTDGPTGANVSFSVPEVADFRTGAPSLKGGIAEYSPSSVILRGDNSAVSINVGLVTGNYFEVMGLKPVLGRLTNPGDDGTGVPIVMVLTHAFWRTHYGADSSIVGKQVRVGAGLATVIGVAEPAPTYPDRIDAYFNMVTSPHHLSAQMVQNRLHRMTQMVARLAPGATIAHARAEVAAVYARMQAEHQESYNPTAHYRVAVIPYQEVMGERARLTLWLLMGAAAFVMVISAANVVNLTLMRGVRRTQELVVRAALGSGVARLRRLLLAENLVLTIAGAILGVTIATFGVQLLVSLADRYSPRAGEIRLDLTVLGFTLALAIGIALLLSFVASLPKEGTFAAWISAGMARVSGGLRKQRLQRALVVVQVAVSVVLLAGAGLLTRTMILLSEVRTGLETQEVLTIPVQLVDLSRLNPAGDAGIKADYERMRSEIAALPGVVTAGVGSNMPLRTTDFEFELNVEGRPTPAGESNPRAEFRFADPYYFRAAGIPLVQGRAFAATDGPGGGKVMIINQTLAHRLFGNADPIGRRVALTGAILKLTPFTGDWRTVVGVTGNTQDGGPDAEPRGALFVPMAQELTIWAGLVIRADSNAAALAGAATRIVRRIAPGVPVENVLTVSQIRELSVAPRRLNAALISSFGILAVIIAAVGIAGVLAFSVSARTNEIGIRMSLGATSGHVQRMILKEGGVLLGIGLALGVAGASLSARVLHGLLFGVTPNDAATFVTVAVVMAAIGTIACWIPALRAARIDPAITMRSA